MSLASFGMHDLVRFINNSAVA